MDHKDRVQILAPSTRLHCSDVPCCDQSEQFQNHMVYFSLRYTMHFETHQTYVLEIDKTYVLEIHKKHHMTPHDTICKCRVSWISTDFNGFQWISTDFKYAYVLFAILELLSC